MKLSETAWDISKEIIDAIRCHPFNIDLANGSLAQDKFSYYVEQDVIFLRDFSRVLAIVAARAPVKFMQNFLILADNSVSFATKLTHDFFKQTFNIGDSNVLTPATLSYTNYLLHICISEPIEIAVAVILPCLWVYMDIGISIISNTTEMNPYIEWIEVYAEQSFARSVQKIIDIFDEIAQGVSEKTKQEMLNVFYKSTALEWHFWDDAYNKRTLYDFLKK